MKHDPNMVAENVLYSAIAGKSNYPYFEQNVVPGTICEIDYSFHECDHAQDVYQQILDENPHLQIYEPS